MQILILYIVFFYTHFVFSEIIIEHAGILPMSPKDIGIQFYYDLKNNESAKYSVYLQKYKCCENLDARGQDCDIDLLGHFLGKYNEKEKKRAILFWPNMYVYNRKGSCKILLSYYKINDKRKTKHLLDHQLDFNTSLEKKQLWRNNVISRNTHECKTGDLDPFKNCIPVNCLIKYNGKMNYFSRTTMLCQKVPSCICSPMKREAVSAYVPSSNTCINLRNQITQKDILRNKRFIKEKSIFGFSPHEGTNIICSHGIIDNKTGFCICDLGWTNKKQALRRYSHDLEPFYMCNVEQKNWKDAHRDKIKNTVIAFSFLSVLIAMLVLILTSFLFCIHNYLIKHLKTCLDDSQSCNSMLCSCND